MTRTSTPTPARPQPLLLDLARQVSPDPNPNPSPNPNQVKEAARTLRLPLRADGGIWEQRAGAMRRMHLL
eukprot:scaffold110329_cov60-Phaeocystis_antarctica.AAC.1